MYAGALTHADCLTALRVSAEVRLQAVMSNKSAQVQRPIKRAAAPVMWHTGFIQPVRFSYRGLLRMRTSIFRPFSHAEQQYLMHLHYYKGRFRVGVGVDVNKTQSNW